MVKKVSMQGERASLGYFSEALNFEHGSTSSNGAIDHWENIHGLGDNDLQDYMIANSESLANSVYPTEQHRFSLGEEEASSSGGGTKNNEASSHNNEIIDLDSDSEQPSGEDIQPVQNVNLNAEYIELDEDVDLVQGNNSVRTGSSVDGRRASCKRKAIEGSSSGQSSLGGYHHGESSSWTPASTEYSRPGNGLNISGSSNFLSVRSNHPSEHQETVNPAAFSAGTIVRRLPVPPSQSNLSRLVPEDPLELRHGQSLGNVFSRNPDMSNMLPPFQWTESSPAVESSSSTERNLHLDENRSTSVVENALFNPAPDLRSASGSLSIASSSSSVSRTGSSTGVQQAPSSNLAWTPHRSLPHHQRRRSELAHRSLISSLSSDATNQRSGRSLAPPPAPQDGLVLQPGGDNSQMHNRGAYSRAGLWLDRQVDSLVGAPQSLRALAAASRGRNRLMVSQVSSYYPDG